MKNCGYLVFLWFSTVIFTTKASVKPEYHHNITCELKTCDLTKILLDLNNNTRVDIKPGTYTLDKNIELEHLTSVLITGTSRSEVLIQCSARDVGFTISRSEDVRIEKLTITKCGAPHVGTSLYNITFNAVFHFVYCRNIGFLDVSVSNNSALGVNLYDVGGDVRFIESEFSFNKKVQYQFGSSGLSDINRWAGGGVYVQFTYCGSMNENGCTKSDDSEHQNYIHHNSYVFQDCVFSSNYAPGPPDLPGHQNTDFLPPQKTDHMSLGRGGGLSLYFRGNASYNHFLIKNCNFTDNFAIWGGGFFTEVVDSCIQNSVVIDGCSFIGNKAKWAGGGMRYGLIQVFDGMRPYNNGTFTDTVFTQNAAIWGGATSVYATEEPLSRNGEASSKIKFFQVKWIKNRASNGAAVGGASWKILNVGGIVVPEFEDTLFQENLVVDYQADDKNFSSNFFYSVVKGQGAICTNAMPFNFRGKNLFLDNVGTVFLMTDAVLTIGGTVEFHRNTGHYGGAIALLGQSWITVTPGSSFLFSKNLAVKGAAIFVQNPGTPNRVASKNCFITYNAPTTLETLVSPDKWKTFFNFSYNNATVAGHAIYSSTLKYCSWFMEVYGFKEKQLFNWTNFVYENVSPLIGTEIATDPVQISLTQNDWTDMSPSDVTNPTVKLVDERNQVLSGIVSVDIVNSNHSNSQVDVSSGNFFPAESNIFSFKLSGKERTPFSLTIQTVTGRVVKAIIPNVTLTDCRPGYYLEGNSRCVCRKSPQDLTETIGITRCQGDRHVFVRIGLWAGTLDGSPRTFVTAPCPSMYCAFSCPRGMSCAPHEYLFNEEPHHQCQGHRTGVLCGKCLPGYSVVLGSDECKLCPRDYSWIGYFVLFLIVGTLVVLGVLLVNVDISTGQYTGCLFFYQVVLLLVRDGFQPDVVLSFLMGLANAQVGLGACMWYGMTDLQKLALTYVLPGYILILCTIVIFLSRNPRCVFTRRSALRAFTTLFLVSYTTITSVSLELLHYATLQGKTMLFKSGDVEFFKGLHLGFGILAIIVCVVIVIPFPLCLCLVQPLSYLKPGLGGGTLKPFIDIFQCCYQSKYRWFSGVYYCARIVLLLIFTFVSESILKHSLLCFACVLLLTLQTNIRPYGILESNDDTDSTSIPTYKETWLNLLDSLLLMNLSFIALIGSISTSNNDSGFTRIASSGYSIADVMCVFLMWLPAPLFLGLIGVNLYKAAKKKLNRIRSSVSRHSVLSRETSVTTSAPSSQ